MLKYKDQICNIYIYFEKQTHTHKGEENEF